MGQKGSRLAGGATSTARRYPARVPQPRPPNPSAQTNVGATGHESSISRGPGPTVHPADTARFEKDEVIRRDAADPDYAQMLKTVGVVQVADAARRVSLAGSHNPQLRTLSQRKAIDVEQERELTGGQGRSWVPVEVIREIIRYRDDRHMAPEKIEKMLGLKKGVVERLGEAVRNV